MIEESNKNINQIAKQDIPLSLFSYKDYNFNFISSWYDVASKIFKKINYSSAEKQRLNLALSVLMFPYIAFIALGFVSYKQFTKKEPKNPILEERKNKSGKKLAYNILTFVIICINVVILTTLLIPVTLALVIFYTLNQELSKDLITALKISKKNGYEDQNITVSIHDEEIGVSNIRSDIKIKFPKQFNRLISDLTKDNNWTKITSGKKGNTTLKLSVDITLKGGLIPLRGEIKKLLDASLKELAVTIGKLIDLKSKDIIHNKLKELLNEFRLKVVDSINSKIVSYLIEDAYKVAFIQAIKAGKERRKEEFISEDRLKEVLIKQELKDQGEKLPTEKEIIIKALNKLKEKEIKVNDVDDQIYKILELEYSKLIEKGELTKKTNIDVYREYFPQKIDEAVSKAEEKIKELKHKGEERYIDIEVKLKETHEALKRENIKDDDLKQELQKLKDLFKLNTDQDILHKNFRRSQLDKAENLLKHIPWDEVKSLTKYMNNQSSINDHKKLHELIINYNEQATDEKINNLINEVIKIVAKHKLQSLYKQQKDKGLELLSKDDIEFFNSKKIIKAELLEEENILLEQLEEEIEEQHRDLKNEHDGIKTNHELVKELIDKSLEILSCKLDLLPQELREKNLYVKTEGFIEKLKAIRRKVHDDIKKTEIEEIIKSIETNIDEPAQLHQKEEYEANIDDQREKCKIDIKNQIVSMALLDRNNIYGSISEIINQYKTVDDEINIQNRQEKQLIKVHLENSEKFLELLKQLKLKQEELTINEETGSAYKARLFSDEKIKFSIIENRLIELLKAGSFDEIKALLGVVELEYCLADRCIKNPTVAIKDNVKHFCRDLLSPLIGELTTNFINNLQKDKDDSWISRGRKKLNAAKNWVQLGVYTDSYKNTNSAIGLTNKTIEKVEEIVQYFETTYEEMGELIGNTFSNKGETFRDVIWPQIKDNLYEILNRSLQDIEIKTELSIERDNGMCGVPNNSLQSTEKTPSTIQKNTVCKKIINKIEECTGLCSG